MPVSGDFVSVDFNASIIYPLWEKMRSTGADIAGVQKCAPVRDKVGCTGACAKLCPTANQMDQNQCNLVYTVSGKKRGQ